MADSKQHNNLGGRLSSASLPWPFVPCTAMHNNFFIYLFILMYYLFVQAGTRPTADLRHRTPARAAPTPSRPSTSPTPAAAPAAGTRHTSLRSAAAPLSGAPATATRHRVAQVPTAAVPTARPQVVRVCGRVCACALFGHVMLKPLWSRSDPPGLPVAVRRLSGARSPPFEEFFGVLLTPFPPVMGCSPRRRPLRIRDPTAPRCRSSSSPSTTRTFRYARARGVCRVGSHALYASSSTHASRTHPMRIHTCTYVYMYIFIHFTRTHPSSYWPRIWA